MASKIFIDSSFLVNCESVTVLAGTNVLKKKEYYKEMLFQNPLIQHTEVIHSGIFSPLYYLKQPFYAVFLLA